MCKYAKIFDCPVTEYSVKNITIDALVAFNYDIVGQTKSFSFIQITWVWLSTSSQYVYLF